LGAVSTAAAGWERGFRAQASGDMSFNPLSGQVCAPKAQHGGFWHETGR
jgi:hypothetical protein